jgi:glycosyltransferase involved in cell wall biosynthesis
MRILLAQDTFFPQVGGAEVHVLKLAQALAGRGHDVRVVTATPGPSEVGGIQVERLPGVSGRGRRSWVTVPLSVPRLAGLVAGADVVHGHYTARLSALSARLARLLGKRFVVTLHGHGTLDSSVGDDRRMQRWREIGLRLADRVICTSSEMAEVARRFVGDDRILVIPSGVDMAEFAGGTQAGSETTTVGTVRRLVPKNGVQYLVEAMPAIVKGARGDVRFSIVGDGRLRDYLETRVRDLGVGDKVTFHGTMAPEDVKERLQSMDVVVFPSSAEATSIAALEAMAMGKPVVASAVGGFPELLGASQRGVLVELFDRTTSDYEAPLTLAPERIRSLASAILELMEDPERARALGAAARDYVRANHDWARIAAEVERAYV